ncbi:MAG: hypothetical protein IMW98_05745 [Firmicutes bacterium]|nr:hypothetical protein [Bacillota bacterium]
MPRRAWAIALWAGTLLFAGATALHPPLLDPAAARRELLVIAATPYYGALHWAIAAGELLMSLGLAGACAAVGPDATRPAGVAARVLLAAQLALWLDVLIDEALGMTALAAAYAQSRDAAVQAALLAVGRAHGGRDLLLGYVAASVLWMAGGIVCAAAAGRAAKGGSGGRLRARGAWPAALALAGLAAAAAHPPAALPILLATQLPAGVALLWLGWKVWQATTPSRVP